MLKYKKQVVLLMLVLFSLMVLSACTAGINEMEKSGDQDGNTAGFWSGLWHGFIALFTFIISLFTDKVSIYEVHNSGNWYNFGFILGVLIFFSGSGRGSKRKCKE